MQRIGLVIILFFAGGFRNRRILFAILKSAGNQASCNLTIVHTLNDGLTITNCDNLTILDGSDCSIIGRPNDQSRVDFAIIEHPAFTCRTKCDFLAVQCKFQNLRHFLGYGHGDIAIGSHITAGNGNDSSTFANCSNQTGFIYSRNSIIAGYIGNLIIGIRGNRRNNQLVSSTHISQGNIHTNIQSLAIQKILRFRFSIGFRLCRNILLAATEEIHTVQALIEEIIGDKEAQRNICTYSKNCQQQQNDHNDRAHIGFLLFLCRRKSGLISGCIKRTGALFNIGRRKTPTLYRDIIRRSCSSGSGCILIRYITANRALIRIIRIRSTANFANSFAQDYHSYSL